MREEKTRHVPYKYRALGMKVEEKKNKKQGRRQKRENIRENP
jgi:hypothetical protein